MFYLGFICGVADRLGERLALKAYTIGPEFLTQNFLCVFKPLRGAAVIPPDL
jgi:hypothetical protein